MADNPFQSPIPSDEKSEVVTSHSIIQAWERMRFFYNAIIGLSGLLVLVFYCWLHPEQAIEAIAGSVMFAVFANACFCAGPLAELYLSYFKKRAEVPESRWLFFILGTAVSLVPVAAFIMVILFEQ